MAIGLNEFLGAVGTIGVVWGFVGLVPHLIRPDRRAAFWLALTITLFLGQSGGRSFYWDGLPLLLGDERTQVIRDALGGIAINSVWNLMLIAGAYSLLRLLHMLIPDEDRRDWPLWRAPLYPAKVSFAKLIDYLRGIWTDRRNRIGRR